MVQDSSSSIPARDDSFTLKIKSAPPTSGKKGDVRELASAVSKQRAEKIGNVYVETASDPFTQSILSSLSSGENRKFVEVITAEGQHQFYNINSLVKRLGISRDDISEAEHNGTLLLLLEGARVYFEDKERAIDAAIAQRTQGKPLSEEDTTKLRQLFGITFDLYAETQPAEQPPVYTLQDGSMLHLSAVRNLLTRQVTQISSKTLGQGSFGKVDAAQNLLTGEKTVLKTADISKGLANFHATPLRAKIASHDHTINKKNNFVLVNFIQDTQRDLLASTEPPKFTPNYSDPMWIEYLLETSDDNPLLKTPTERTQEAHQVMQDVEELLRQLGQPGLTEEEFEETALTIRDLLEKAQSQLVGIEYDWGHLQSIPFPEPFTDRMETLVLSMNKILQASIDDPNIPFDPSSLDPLFQLTKDIFVSIEETQKGIKKFSVDEAFEQVRQDITPIAQFIEKAWSEAKYEQAKKDVQNEYHLLTKIHTLFSRVVGVQRAPHSVVIFSTSQQPGKEQIGYLAPCYDSNLYEAAKYFSTEQTIEASRHLLIGLVYLFEAGIAHGDLKLENCLFNKDPFEAVISDLGGAQDMKLPKPEWPKTFSPRYINEKDFIEYAAYKKKADYFNMTRLAFQRDVNAMGMMLDELFGPHSDNLPTEQKNKLIKLVQKATDPNWINRPSARQLLSDFDKIFPQPVQTPPP